MARGISVPGPGTESMSSALGGGVLTTEKPRNNILNDYVHWRRKWQPTPVFSLGESRGRGSLVECRLWGRTESDMTEVT